MTIGTLGRKIVFEVSDETALILQEMTRETSGRWAIHETMGAKPKAEFLGPGLQTVNLTIYLSAGLGVRPRSVLEAVEGMVEAGTAEYLVIGNRPVGKKSVSADRIKRNLVHHIQPRGAGQGRPVHHAGGIRMNISPFDFQLQFTFANDAMAELDRKLALLYSTREGTMPLDREFGINMDFRGHAAGGSQEPLHGGDHQKDGPIYPGGAGAVRPMDPWRRGRILIPRW